MKRWWSILPLLFLVGFSVGWRRPYRGRGTQGFNFNFTGGFPTGVVPNRTSNDVFYTRNGAHAIEASATPYACEDIGNGLGRGCWAALSSYINDMTGAGKTLTQFSTGDGWANFGVEQPGGTWAGNSGMDRVASCATGPDGLTPATCLYDFTPSYTASWQKLGADSTLREVLSSIWVKSTGVASPAFSGGLNFNFQLERTQGFGPLANPQEYAEDFVPDQNGNVTCVSFVKSLPDPDNSHIITLWDVDTQGLLLTVNTTGETASGWQSTRLSSPIALTGGKHYRLSIAITGAKYYTENIDLIGFPQTQNHMTVDGAFYTLTVGSYPNIDITSANTWFTQDICFEPTANNTTRSDPTKTGAFLTVNSNVNPAAFPASPSQWTRLAAGFVSDGTNPVFGAMLLYPAGAHVSGNQINSWDAGSVGGLAFWGPQTAVGVIGGDPPMVLGTSGNLKMTVTDPAILGTIPASDGRFNIVADWLVDGQDIAFGQATPSNTLFDFDTPDGKFNLQDGDQTVLTAMVRGVDYITSGLSINIGLLQPDTIFRTQLYYDPAVPEATIAGWVNGCAASGATVGSISGAVHTPTLAAIGSLTNGTNQTQRRVTSWARGDLVGRPDPYRSEFLIQGDSLMSEYPGDHPAVCKYIYTVAQSIERSGIFSYAFPGETIEQQYTRYAASKQFGQPYVHGITEQAGINNISVGQTDVQTIGHYQTAVTGFNTNNSGAKVYLMPLWPTNATLSAPQQGYYLNVNQAIIGQGGTPITGSNLVRMYPGTTLWASGIYWPFINDGANNLASWTSVDGRHQNTAGSVYMGAVTAGYFQANGQLPGGAAPTCTGFSPASGAVGATVTLTGTGFSSVIGAGFNAHGIGSGIPVSDTSVTVVVPSGATTGPVTVANPLGTVTCSGGNFTVM
jgi:Domain of unknown function (DUF4082)